MNISIQKTQNIFWKNLRVQFTRTICVQFIFAINKKNIVDVCGRETSAPILLRIIVHFAPLLRSGPTASHRHRWLLRQSPRNLVSENSSFTLLRKLLPAGSIAQCSHFFFLYFLPSSSYRFSFHFLFGAMFSFFFELVYLHLDMIFRRILILRASHDSVWRRAWSMLPESWEPSERYCFAVLA